MRLKFNFFVVIVFFYELDILAFAY